MKGGVRDVLGEHTVLYKMENRREIKGIDNRSSGNIHSTTFKKLFLCSRAIEINLNYLKALNTT